MILVHSTEVSFSVAPQGLTATHYWHANAYAFGLLTHRVTPTVTQIIIPFAPGAPSSSVPAPPTPPPTPPPTQPPANNHRSGNEREDDLALLEQQILSSPWHAANALEPVCGSPECPHLADRYGVRGMSCYTALVVTNPDGTFRCWREECSANPARHLEDVVKHQRTNHFNHKPFLCVPTNNTVW